MSKLLGDKQKLKTKRPKKGGAMGGKRPEFESHRKNRKEKRTEEVIRKKKQEKKGGNCINELVRKCPQKGNLVGTLLRGNSTSGE